MPHRFTSLVLLLVLLGAPVCARGDNAERAEVERSVDRALKYLAGTQNADGSWGAKGESSTAITSLCLLSFMARGHVAGQGEYGDLLNRGIDNVLSLQGREGLLTSGHFSHAMYDHGISTVMLTQAYGMITGKTANGMDRRKAIETAVGRAVRVILAAQQVSKPREHMGGWRYMPSSSDSDISVTGWQLMALRGAGNVGAAVPRRAIDQGIAYILDRHTPDGGFAYTGRMAASPARTGTGVLALQLLGKPDLKEAIEGGQYLLSAVQNRHDGALESNFRYYAVYYCSQAAFQLGGKYDEQINAYIRSSLLKSQKPDGKWTVTGIEGTVGDAYPTAMATLALCVQFHYLPLYQR